MTKQKKIFVGACVVFAGLLGYASYDISSKTTFPGSKAQLPERLKKQSQEKQDTASSGKTE